VGVFVKDNFQGQFLDEWKTAFEKESFEKVSRSLSNFKEIVETYLFQIITTKTVKDYQFFDTHQ